jgi:hypothetical protein
LFRHEWTERWVQWVPWILRVDVSPNSGVLPNETKKQMLDERRRHQTFKYVIRRRFDNEYTVAYMS